MQGNGLLLKKMGGGGGGTLIFSYIRRLGPLFLGSNFVILIFWVFFFQKNDFLGVDL